VTPAAGGAQVRRGRGQPEGGLAGGLGNDLLWSRARAARPAPARAPPRWRRPAQAAPPTYAQPAAASHRGGCAGPRPGHGPPRPPRDPRHRRLRARASADPGRWWIGRTAPVRRNAVGPWAARQAPISAAADASSCFAQRSSSLPASIAGELDLGEGYLWFDLLVAGWLRALPIPRAASSSRLTPSTRVAIATLVATPPKLSLSEHDQRARGRRQANPAATICWSPYSSPLTHAAMDAGLPPICVGQSSPLRVRRAVGRRRGSDREARCCIPWHRSPQPLPPPPPRTPRSCQLGFGCWQDGWLDRMRLVAGRRRPCRLLAADDRRSDEMMFTGKPTERAGAPLDFCIASCVVHRGSGRWRAAGRDGC